MARSSNIDKYVKQGNLNPKLQTVIKDSSGAVVDLTAVVGVKVRMQPVGDPSVKKINDAAGTVDNPAAGLIGYQQVAADVDTPGDYVLEWELDWGASTPQTVPDKQFDLIRIEPKLA